MSESWDRTIAELRDARARIAQLEAEIEVWQTEGARDDERSMEQYARFRDLEEENEHFRASAAGLEDE